MHSGQHGNAAQALTEAPGRAAATENKHTHRPAHAHFAVLQQPLAGGNHVGCKARARLQCRRPWGGGRAGMKQPLCWPVMQAAMAAAEQGSASEPAAMQGKPCSIATMQQSKEPRQRTCRSSRRRARRKPPRRCSHSSDTTMPRTPSHSCASSCGSAAEPGPPAQGEWSGGGGNGQRRRRRRGGRGPLARPGGLLHRCLAPVAHPGRPAAPQFAPAPAPAPGAACGRPGPPARQCRRADPAPWRSIAAPGPAGAVMPQLQWCPGRSGPPSAVSQRSGRCAIAADRP